MNLLISSTAKTFLLLLIAAGSARPVSAQSASVSVDPKRGTVEDVFTVAVTVADAGQIDTPPSFAAGQEFTIRSIASSVDRRIVNRVQQSRTTFTFEAAPSPGLTPGIYTLPQVRLVVDGKPLRLEGPKIAIAPANAAHGGEAKASPVLFSQTVDNLTPFVGQQVAYRVDIAADNTLVSGTLADADFKGFWREDLPAKEKQSRRQGRSAVRSFHEVLFPKKEGRIEIPVRELAAKFAAPRQQNGRSGGGLFQDPGFSEDFFSGWRLFSQERTISKRLTAAPIVLNVRPLPPAPVPDPGFIPVGSLDTTASVDKRQATQGESITMRVALAGTANLRPLDLPAFSEEESRIFKRYDDKPDLKTAFDGERVIYTKTYTLALVPLSPGTLKLPVFRVLTFDPLSEKYRYVETPGGTIDVLPGHAEQQIKISAAGIAAALEEKQREKSKQDITIVAEDLLPQHVGRETLQPDGELPVWIFALILAGAPLCAAALHRRLSQEALLRRDPALLLQKGACAKAFLALAALRQNPGEAGFIERLRAAVRTYLADRLRLSMEGRTAAELGAVLASALHDEHLAGRFSSFFSRLEELLYAPHGSPGAGDRQELSDEAERLIAAMEDCLGRKKSA